MIKPTIGRKVWFWPNGNQWPALNLKDKKTPCDATVVYVWGDRMVNLVVRDHDGNQHPVTSVKLIQEGDILPRENSGEFFAEWMPYQQGQAKKEQTS